MNKLNLVMFLDFMILILMIDFWFSRPVPLSMELIKDEVGAAVYQKLYPELYEELYREIYKDVYQQVYNQVMEEVRNEFR